MTKYIASLFAAVAIAATSCSTTRCGHAAPDLAGNWEMAGPYNVGQPCLILQSGNYLTFINEKGDRARGILKSPVEVIALDWEGGLTGRLDRQGTRISWRNGTWWVRRQAMAEYQALNPATKPSAAGALMVLQVPDQEN